MGVGGAKAWKALQKIGPWGETARLLAQAETDIDLALSTALEREAALYLRSIKLGIRSGSPGGRSFQKLSEKTKKEKRSTKPLIRTGGLLSAIKIHKINPRARFVGIARGERGSRGGSGRQSYHYIAEIHEYGTHIYFQRVNAAQAKLFRKLNKKGIIEGKIGVGTILYMRVPERPFIRPVVEELSKGAGERITRQVFLKMGLIQGFKEPRWS